MKHLFAVGVLAVAGMANATEVPRVADPDNIVVNGKHMTQQAFVKKYCASAPANETCVAVKRAWLKNSTKGAVPRF